MLKSIQWLLKDIVDLIYPRTCAACFDAKPVQDGIFCISCLSELPETNYHLIEGNPFEIHFWGRVPLQAGAAFLFFVPDGRTQTLLHNIKYRSRSDFARTIGEFYGSRLKHAPRFRGLDMIIPVPLHWKKEHTRGFNQSAEFGKGLAESMSLVFLKNGLTRTRYTDTQTKKSRAERVSNLKDAFVVTDSDKLRGKHILLVDDVLTTGATLESCALALLQVEGVKVSMATIACGRL
ncbi:MAG TPA: phosphoribosyltransferase family protein [Saprospiraceae bacterium]|nr:phosphoribosyltransferase family protein [Saprospiraceae bacterium]